MKRISILFALTAIACQSTTQKRVQGQECGAAAHSANVYARYHDDVTMETVPGKDDASACCRVMADGSLRTEICLTETRTADGWLRYDYKRTIHPPR